MTAPATPWPARRHLATGFLGLFLLVFCLGGWAAFARISGAVIAPGVLEVEGNRQVVQHHSGGIVEAILVRDGDAVEEGAVLLKLDGERSRSDLAVVEGQFFELLARKDRLAAERDDLAAVAFHPDLLARAQSMSDAAQLVAAQVQEFQAQRKSLAEERSQLRERIVQIGLQIEGLEAQRRATEEQAELLSVEISAQEALFQRGLTRQAELLAPQRELARMRGSLGQIDAAIAESAAKMAEIEIEILRLSSERRRAAIAELRDLEFREIELRERRGVLQEEITRLELRAPASGTVYGSTVDTIRAVIRPAEPILYVVPSGVPLVVRARVEPVQVDSVRAGQNAVLRFSAFNSRTTPEVEGEVLAVSADAIADERTGMSFYRVDIRLHDAARAKLEGLELLPGMPVEAFIRTDERSPLSYLVKPLADYFHRALRET